MIRRIAPVLLLLTLLPLPTLVRAGTEGLPEDTTTLGVVSDTGQRLAELTVHVADSPMERYVGLSRAQDLADTRGMIFVYDRADTRSFVMRNMAFPLDMLFFGADGQLLTIHRATVKSDTQFYRGRARWVLEVNQGWARGHNITTGDRLIFDDGWHQ